MEECIFCKIAKGEIPCVKIWEDESFLSFLDINPITEGMTLVIPKKHLDSKVFVNTEEEISSIMTASKNVSKILEYGLDIDRVAVIFEGIEVGHLHAKLIPEKVGENLKIIINSNYPKPSIEELKILASKLRSDN